MDGSGWHPIKPRTPSPFTLLVVALLVVAVGYTVAIRLRVAEHAEGCAMLGFKHCEPHVTAPR